MQSEKAESLKQAMKDCIKEVERDISDREYTEEDYLDFLDDVLNFVK